MTFFPHLILKMLCLYLKTKFVHTIFTILFFNQIRAVNPTAYSSRSCIIQLFIQNDFFEKEWPAVVAVVSLYFV